MLFDKTNTRVYVVSTGNSLKPEKGVLKELPRYFSDRIPAVKSDRRLNELLCMGLLLSRVMNELSIDRGAEITVNDCGKPFFKDYSGVRFNFSHSANRLMLAVSSTEIGCDTERNRPVDLKIARRYFAEDEYSFINNSSDKYASFFRIWTLKESYVKAIGCGFKNPPASFSVSIAPGEVNVIDPVNNFSPVFYEYGLNDEYAYSVCLLSGSQEKPELITGEIAGGGLVI